MRRLIHLTTADISLELLIGPQLSAFRSAGDDVVGVSAPGPFVPSIEARGIEHVFACGPHADAVAEGFGCGAKALASREEVAAACREFDRTGNVILVKGSRSAGMEAVVAALVEAEPGTAGTETH